MTVSYADKPYNFKAIFLAAILGTGALGVIMYYGINFILGSHEQAKQELLAQWALEEQFCVLPDGSRIELAGYNTYANLQQAIELADGRKMNGLVLQPG